MAKSLKIPVSFKKDEENLYKYTKSKRNASCYIKDLIEKDMKSSKKDNINFNPVDENKNSNNDLGLDF